MEVKKLFATVEVFLTVRNGLNGILLAWENIDDWKIQITDDWLDC